MRIVVDLQGALSNSSGTRGIGRYTSALTEALARQAQGHDVVFALNSQFPDAIDRVRERLGGLVPPENFRVWQSAPFSPQSSPGYVRAQEKLYEAFLASLQPDVVFITSLFEGLGDAATTSIGSFAEMPTAVSLYDLIPLIHARPYLDNATVRGWYMRKVNALRRADMWFAISESSRREGIDYLGFDPDRCINVSTAADDHFRKIEIPAEREQALRAQYALHRPFIMYTGGIDHRKNIEGLIRAFAQLPAELRGRHHLAIVCSARPEDRNALLDLARRQGLADGDVVVTGFVPDQDLVELYNLCALFVFPSWHEGFGLPALEAMRCGAVVIGANTSSVPEVIGLADALFDPHDDAAIASKLVQGLTDNAFRSMLLEHGRRQADKFSWAESARRTLKGLELLHETTKRPPAKAPAFRRLRPRLAYLSPLPPERSGIASYSAELLPELARHYDIELITDLHKLGDPVLSSSFPTRSIEWFREHHDEFERVLYHFGNSEFHEHMFDLLAEIPGTVVLHDFYLSGAWFFKELRLGETSSWAEALYASHGYAAVAERYRARDAAEVVYKYPCSFDVIARAQGIIVHSRYSIDLAKQWFGDAASDKWALVPHLRVLPASDGSQRANARRELGLGEDDFLVCSFGLLGPTKLNHRLLDSWFASALATDPHCHLVFVGETGGTPYGADLEQEIAVSGNPRIKITGWADDRVFQRYLDASDLAVQLRSLSRGETSGTVLDAMSRGVATIVNANGSMASLPEHAVVMLPDEFSNAQLVRALEGLRLDTAERLALGARARQAIKSLHAPDACARGYANAIESFAANAAGGRDELIEAIWASDGPLDAPEAARLASAVATTLPPPAPLRQLFIDVSALVQSNGNGASSSSAKTLLRWLLEEAPAGYRIEPVYARAGEHGYRYARRFTLGFLECPDKALQDVPIDFRPDELFVVLDSPPGLVLEQRDYYRQLRHAGVRVGFVIQEASPAFRAPQSGKAGSDDDAKWLDVVAENHGVVCTSEALAKEFSAWLAANTPSSRRQTFSIRTFEDAADPAPPPRAGETPKGAAITLASISRMPSFLAVESSESGRSHEAVLDAFEQLWTQGVKAGLVIVERHRAAGEFAARLGRHRELGKRLFWIQDAGDAYLEKLYSASTCLLAVSEGEGAALPLVEAARHGLPILASDLPVYRDAASTHAYYFEVEAEGDGVAVAAAVNRWLALFRRNDHPRPGRVSFPTQQQQSAATFTAALLEAVAHPRKEEAFP